MPVTTKAEAEALTVVELKVELENRGLPTEGVKADLLETLLDHMDKAANGESATPATNGVEKPKEDDQPKEDTEKAAETPAETPAVDGETVGDGETAPKAEEAAAPAEASVAPDASEPSAAVTRSADEVTGGTDEPEPKKAKTVETEAAIEEPEAAPASEPAATA